ncbi:MAG TPA: hypothetical protein VLG11_05660 [Candidatus Saccharimonadales bacterium]|nr:hypothetical protein [Candidatus Saccharimonadales bacterium]
MNSRRVGMAATLTAAAAFSAGCGMGETSKSIDIMPANNTAEQVAHNLGSEETLGKLGLKQQFKIDMNTTFGKQTLDLYNYTNSPVDPQAFERIATVYEQSVANTQTFNFAINPKSAEADVAAQASTIPNPDQEHDFVLVPKDMPTPPLFDGDSAEGATTDLPERRMHANQTISVIHQPEDGGDLQPFFGHSAALTTEMCQALVEATPQPLTEVGDALTGRLTQEVVCNSVGDAALHAMQGDDYDAYKASENNAQGLITIPLVGDYIIKEFVVQESTYADLQRAVQG